MMWSLLLIPFLSLAQDNLEIEIFRQNKMNFKLVDVVHREKGEFLINGVKGTKAQQPKIKKWIQLAKELEQPSKAACVAGTYTLTVKENGALKKFSGCAEGPIYGKIMAELYRIKAE